MGQCCASSSEQEKGDKLHQHGQNQLISSDNKDRNLPGEAKLAPAHESKQDSVNSDRVCCFN